MLLCTLCAYMLLVRGRCHRVYVPSSVLYYLCTSSTVRVNARVYTYVRAYLRALSRVLTDFCKLEVW